MSTPQDMKAFGLPTTHPRMSNRMRAFVGGCLAVIAVGTGYVLVNDTAERKVVDVNMTITTTEYAEALDRARKQGEADAMKRMRACDWRDTFKTEPPMKKWSKT